MSDQPRPTPKIPLSQRVRPDCEVAGYVHREIVNLERESDASAETIAALANNLAASDNRNASLRGRIAELEKQFREDTKDIERLEAENAKLREALGPAEEIALWLESALKCKDWHWDPDQYACAESALTAYRQALAGKDMGEPTA